MPDFRERTPFLGGNATCDLILGERNLSHLIKHTQVFFRSEGDTDNRAVFINEVDRPASLFQLRLPLRVYKRGNYRTSSRAFHQEYSPALR